MFDEPFVQVLLSDELPSIVIIIALSVLRTLGMTFGFLGLNWGMGSAFMVRAGVAMGLAFPLIMINTESILVLADTVSQLEISVLFVKEFALGYALGFVSSLPFFVLKFAGAILDNYRGESDSGIVDPLGEPLTTQGLVCLVIGFFLFAANGGFWELAMWLYQSYEVWPIASAMPTFADGAASRTLAVLDDLLAASFLAVAPIMLFVAAVDFALIISARLASRFQFYNMAFPAKNLATLLLLPLYVYFLVIWLNQAGGAFPSGLPVLESFLK